MSLDLSSFRSAINLLEESLKVYFQYQDSSEELERTLRKGVIQVFEVCYEMNRKMLIRYLKEYYGDNFNQMTIKDIFRYAEKVGILSEAEKWFEYKEYRDKTSHTYDSNIAEQVFSKANDFLQDAKYSLKKMEQQIND